MVNRVQIVSARLPTSQSRRLSENILAFMTKVSGQNLNIDMDDTMSTAEQYEETSFKKLGQQTEDGH